MSSFSRLFALFSGLLCVIAVSCTKSNDAGDPTVTADALWLHGHVVNGATHQPIFNATVEITGLTTLVTDATGSYALDVTGIAPGNYTVRARAEGYGYGSVMAQVSGNVAVANTIGLIPLSAPVTITPQGGSISTPDPEAIVTGSQTTVKIPANAFSENTNISLTRLTGSHVPGYPPVNNLNMGVFHLASAGLTPGLPVEVNIPLPLQNLQAVSLPLLKYDPVSDTWQPTGTEALIDHEAGIAMVNILAFGTYSLALPGNYNETLGNSGPQTDIKVDPDQSSVVLAFMAENDYPGGVPSAISSNYLANIASQNSCLHGIKVSFIDSTYVTVSYIGHKPDSVVTTKATSSGYYQWIPQVGTSWIEVPYTTVVDGISVSGIVHKELQVDSGYWQFIHDQGGGGK